MGMRILDMSMTGHLRNDQGMGLRPAGLFRAVKIPIAGVISYRYPTSTKRGPGPETKEHSGIDGRSRDINLPNRIDNFKQCGLSIEGESIGDLGTQRVSRAGNLLPRC